MPNLGGPELLIVLAVVLLLFCSTHLPGLARSIGQASRSSGGGPTATQPPVLTGKRRSAKLHVDDR